MTCIKTIFNYPLTRAQHILITRKQDQCSEYSILIGTFTLSTLCAGLTLSMTGQDSASFYVLLSGASVGCALNSALPWLNFCKLKSLGARASSSLDS